MSMSRYLTGNKVYRSGSSAPTMGTVDPSGYVERELQKRNTGMMQEPSQTRSGLAQAALARLRSMGSSGNPNHQPLPQQPLPPHPGQATGWTGQGHWGTGEIPLRGTQQPPPGGESDQSVRFAALQHTLQAKLAAAQAEHATGLAQLQQQTDGRPQVSPTGTLQPAAPAPVSSGFHMPEHMAFQSTITPVGSRPSEGSYSPAPVPTPAPVASPVPAMHSVPTTMPASAPAAHPAGINYNNATALPYDYESSMDEISATGSLGQLLNQLMMGRQAAQRDYAAGMHKLDMEQPGDERNLLNQFAGRGLAHSSGYGVGFGNLENEYAGERTNLADTLAQLMTQYGLQQAQGQGTYDQQLAMIKLAAAQRLAQNAGGLGLGR